MSGKKFSGKVVIITGAGNGIGAGTAKKFAELGATLALIDINGEALQKVADECHTFGKALGNPKPFIVIGDLTVDSIREKFVANTLKYLGHIDILFNCAGILQPSSILTETMSVFDKIINLNLRATYDMCRLCAHHLIKTKGCIINVSSLMSYTPFGSGGTVYALSKAAIRHLTVCLADELGPHGVRAVSISPGTVKTDMVMKALPAGAPEEPFLKKLAEFNMVDRIGFPEDIANAVTFLASDEAAYITGTDLRIDGGSLHKRRV